MVWSARVWWTVPCSLSCFVSSTCSYILHPTGRSQWGRAFQVCLDTLLTSWHSVLQIAGISGVSRRDCRIWRSVFEENEWDRETICSCISDTTSRAREGEKACWSSHILFIVRYTLGSPSRTTAWMDLASTCAERWTTTNYHCYCLVWLSGGNKLCCFCEQLSILSDPRLLVML